MKFKQFKLLYFVIFFFFVSITIFFALNSKLIKARNSEECFVCHEDKELTMEKNGKKTSVYVDPSLYKKSTHGGFDCKDCHEGYNPDVIPHNPNKKKIDCKSCHDNVKGLDKSVHKNNDCKSCHNPHYQTPVKDMKEAQTSECLKCHNNKNVRDFTTSIHNQRNIGCNGCHNGGHEVKKISKGEINSLCGKCHGPHQSEFNNSVHMTALKNGNQIGPDCVSCHGAHKIIGSQMSIESQACLKCHLDEKLFPGEEKGSAKFVANYKTSVHSAIQKNGKPAAGCVDCHGDHMISNDPKQSSVKAHLLETCGKCHSNEVKDFDISAHGQAFKNGDKNAPSCTGCHGEHNIKAVLTSDEFSKINQTEMCLSCHNGDKIETTKNAHTEDYKKSVHYLALKDGKTDAATCSDCHGPHKMLPASDPSSPVYKKNVAQTCGQSECHTTSLKDYTGSVHQVSVMNKEKSDAPTCSDCHGNHQIVNADTALIRQGEGNKPKAVVQLCSSCHASVEIIENNKLKNVAGTYLESFHGLAIRGGSKEAADCASCHSYHNVRNSDDSLSTIHPTNLGKTCGKCHPGANEVLLNTKIHTLEARSENPLLFWVSRFYIIIIIAVIGSMVLHNILDYRRKLKEKKAENK